MNEFMRNVLIFVVCLGLVLLIRYIADRIMNRPSDTKRLRYILNDVDNLHAEIVYMVNTYSRFREDVSPYKEDCSVDYKNELLILSILNMERFIDHTIDHANNSNMTYKKYRKQMVCDANIAAWCVVCAMEMMTMKEYDSNYEYPDEVKNRLKRYDNIKSQAKASPEELEKTLRDLGLIKDFDDRGD